MKEREKKYIALWQVMQRECRRLVSRPLYLFCMVIAPLFCYVFFTTLMDSGLPKDLPAGVVDMDDSSTSRNIVRNLDAFSQTGVVAHYSNVSDARIAVQEGKIYGFFYIPKGLSAEAQSQRQPTISFYTNYSYLIAGSLLFRDSFTLGGHAALLLLGPGGKASMRPRPRAATAPYSFPSWHSFQRCVSRLAISACACGARMPCMAKTPHGSDAQSPAAASAIFRISPSRTPSSRISTAAVHEASNRLFSAVVRTISPSRPSLSACVENPLAAEAMRAFHDRPSVSDSRSILMPLAFCSNAPGMAGGSGACGRNSAATATMEMITPQNSNGIFQPVARLSVTLSSSHGSSGVGA